MEIPELPSPSLCEAQIKQGKYREMLLVAIDYSEIFIQEFYRNLKLNDFS